MIGRILKIPKMISSVMALTALLFEEEIKSEKKF